MLKIVIASGTYPPEIGGMATFVYTFARLLQERNIGVRVLAYGDHDRAFNDPFPVQIVSRRRNLFARYWHYYRAVRAAAVDVDIIYAQDLISSGLPAALVSRWTGKKLLLRLGGDFLWEKMVEYDRASSTLTDYYQQPKNFKEKMFLAIYLFVLGSATKIVFNTNYQAQLYQRLFSQQITAEKTAVIENSCQPTNRGRAYTSAGDFVYLGRFIRLKNLERLIRAFAKVPTDKKLLLIGDGPQRQELEQLIMQQKLERIKLLPPVGREQVLNIVAGSYALIMPSLTELNPNAVLEALSVGTPVLVTFENGLPEVIKEKLEMFHPLDEDALARKIVWLLNPDNYVAYRRRLQTIQFNQTWDKTVEKHLEIFKLLA